MVISLTACSDSDSTKDKKQSNAKKQDTEIVDAIKKPLDKAKALQKTLDDRAKKVDAKIKEKETKKDDSSLK